MYPPIIAFTSPFAETNAHFLVYHLAHSLARMGVKVLCIDADAEAHLSREFLNERELVGLWEKREAGTTVANSFDANFRAISPKPVSVSENIALLPGAPAIVGLSQVFVERWLRARDNGPGEKNVGVFWRLAQLAAGGFNNLDGLQNEPADIILMTPGYYLDPVARMTLVASDFVTTVTGCGARSLYGLKIYGEVMNDWRKTWLTKVRENLSMIKGETVPQGDMKPLGYFLTVPLNNSSCLLEDVPIAYHKYVLGEEEEIFRLPAEDPSCIADVTPLLSDSVLMDDFRRMAKERRKPVFMLDPRDIPASMFRHMEFLEGKCAEIAKSLIDHLDRENCFVPYLGRPLGTKKPKSPKQKIAL